MNPEAQIDEEGAMPRLFGPQYEETPGVIEFQRRRQVSQRFDSRVAIGLRTSISDQGSNEESLQSSGFAESSMKRE